MNLAILHGHGPRHGAQDVVCSAEVSKFEEVEGGREVKRVVDAADGVHLRHNVAPRHGRRFQHDGQAEVAAESRRAGDREPARAVKAVRAIRAGRDGVVVRRRIEQVDDGEGRDERGRRLGSRARDGRCVRCVAVGHEDSREDARVRESRGERRALPDTQDTCSSVLRRALARGSAKGLDAHDLVVDEQDGGRTRDNNKHLMSVVVTQGDRPRHGMEAVGSFGDRVDELEEIKSAGEVQSIGNAPC